MTGESPMQKIANLNIYVGTKEEYRTAVSQGMKIVCALNRANGFVTRQYRVCCKQMVEKMNGFGLQNDIFFNKDRQFWQHKAMNTRNLK